MKKTLFCFMILGAFFLTGNVFAKSNKKNDGYYDRYYFKYNIIDDCDIEITGTQGLKDIRLLFVYCSKKGEDKKALEDFKEKVIDNIDILIDDIPYKLKFEKKSLLRKLSGRVKKGYKTIAYDYTLEFVLDTPLKKLEKELPNSILLQSKHQMINPSGSFINNVKEMSYSELNGIKNYDVKGFIVGNGGKTYDSKKTPFDCLYMRFFRTSFGITRESARVQTEQKKQQEQQEIEKNNLISRILAKMGYRIVNSFKGAVNKGDVFISDGNLKNPVRMFIQDVNFNGSMFSYLVATGYTLDTLDIYGDVFYILSDRQLNYTNIYGRGNEITETLSLKYVGTDTYRHGYTIKECKVFTVMNKNETNTIVNVIENPEKYKYLLDK